VRVRDAMVATRSSPARKEEQPHEAPSSTALERRARWKYKGTVEKKVGKAAGEIHTWRVAFAAEGLDFGLVLDSDDKDANFVFSRSAQAFGFTALLYARVGAPAATEEEAEAQKQRISRLLKISARMDVSRTGYAAESAAARRAYDKHRRRREEETTRREGQIAERFPKLNLRADAVPQEECVKSYINQATLYISGTTRKANWIHVAAAAAARHTRVCCGTGCSTYFSQPGTVCFGGCFVGPLALVAESALLFAKVVAAANRHFHEARPARSVDGAAMMEGYIAGWAASARKEEDEEVGSPAREAAWQTIADASAAAANAWFGWRTGTRHDSNKDKRGYDAAFGAGSAEAEDAKKLRRAAVAPRSLLS
jgi:hypothetical protein